MATTRLSGLISGMDTESMIAQLMEGRRTKVTNKKKDQIALQYKQDKWKELNTKLKNLQSKFVSNMRYSSSYSKKTSSVSNTSAASVITGENAVDGVQTIRVEKLAKTAYLTGGQLGDGDDKGKGNYTALTKMSELGISDSGNITVSTGGKDYAIEITGDTTISDVLNKFKEAGLNANFDAKNQRFFVSSKESGLANDFSITASDDTILTRLGLKVGDGGAGATKVSAQDSVIYLNDAEFRNSSNVFEVNGLTITALSETKPGEEVTITTQNDVSGIYNMVKNFLKEYNSVINEIDKLYNSASIGTMKPMTSEEKEAVSESEAEEWEKKLRESSLRRDSNLSSISDALKSAMSASFTINGKEMSLSDFGIGTLGYFEAADNEKNMYHIDGDSDDESTSGKADKLRSLISSDPSTVISFFTKLGQELYSNMSNISKSVDGYRSFGNFYDDKKMKTDYDDYNSKIAELEEKLNVYEDKWYSKFAKMESAMAKMQSNTSAVSALLGGS